MALAQNKTGHFLLRLAGLTGLMVAGCGLAGWAITQEMWGVWLLLSGGLLVVVALLFELKEAASLMTSRRGAFGINVAAQVVLAAILLVGINVVSFWNHARFDWTSDHEFTIPRDIQEQLSRLRGETRIVVLQRHTSFGQVAEKQDNYDAAAERQIVAKVRDLADEFRELGARFKVETLDIQDESYEDRLAKIRQDDPKLAEAIDKSPENSIFFYAKEKAQAKGEKDIELVQRLGFHDIYQLDKQASKAANDGRGNLVLLYQGIGPFARKILNLDERQPRIATGIIHEVLGLENPDELGMAGARKALQSHGFLSKDIVLKRWTDNPGHAVLTQDESKYERLEEQLAELDAAIATYEKQRSIFKALIKDWQTKPVSELKKSAVARQLDLDDVDEEIRKLVLDRVLFRELALRENILKQIEKERTSTAEEKATLNVENLEEQRRIADLRAKFNRMLADSDLLIVPRMTLFNMAKGPNDRIPNAAHRLDEAQVDAIKDFIRSGKPVLFCLGPTSEQPGRVDPLDLAGDKLEMALRDLGFDLNKQTVLFNVEAKALAERRSGIFFLGAPPVEPPPVLFEWKPGAGRPGLDKTTQKLPENPIRVSMRITARSFGKDEALDLRLRHPRPVYADVKQLAKLGAKPKFDPVFMMTDPKGWNEEQPFPSRDRPLRYEPPKEPDPDRGTTREKRLGSFPIGVSVESRAPASWQQSGKGTSQPVRLAVIGHGGVFMGPNLTPAREKLLLDCVNWLLGRDDLLARDSQTWKFPRVAMLPDSTQFALWHWGVGRSMPVLFIYIGLVVLMVRRMR